MRTANLKMAHTAYIGYGVGYLEHRYLENWANDFPLNSPSFKVLTSPKFDQNFICFKTL